MKRTRLNPYDERASDAIDEAINQWIHKEKYRTVLHLKLVDGLTYEEVAERMDMSPKGVQKIVYKAEDILFKHLELTREPVTKD